jgi:hypothetical protein
MNIQLSGAEEWIDQTMTSVLGQVLIRYVHHNSMTEDARLKDWSWKNGWKRGFKKKANSVM